MVKCQIPPKKTNERWRNYEPTNCHSYLDWYYCDPTSLDCPLRHVSEPMNKPEPHYEDGTFNECTSCNQPNLNKAINDRERYVFFFTKYAGRDKNLREKFGKKYCITGYYEIGKTKNVNWGRAVQSKKTCFYNMNDSFPLEKIDGWNPNWNRNPRYTKKHLSMEDTQKIIKHFSNKKNRISFYIRETKKLYS